MPTMAIPTNSNISTDNALEIPATSSTSTAVQAVLLPIFSLLAILILIVPFIWHFRLRNIGACSLILYINLANLITFVNALIWPSDDLTHAWNGVGLCDVEVKLRWPLVTGLSCATLCITRNLANVLDVEQAQMSVTRAARRRKTFVDLGICYVLPLLQVLLHYVIQSSRYWIVTLEGCAAVYDRSWPTIVIMYMWPVIFSLINCYYAVMTIHRLRKYRATFPAILSSSSNNLTTARFMRLFIMSLSLLVIYTPFVIYLFYVNLSVQWLPYDWDLIHDPATWNNIAYLPTLGIRTFSCWLAIAMSLFVFVYFGLGGDAVDIYRRWLLRAGVGRLFPCLRTGSTRPQRRGRRSWTSKWSLVSRARHYFDPGRKDSSTTLFGLDSDLTSTSLRRPSIPTSTTTTTSTSSNPVINPLANHPFISPCPCSPSPLQCTSPSTITTTAIPSVPPCTTTNAQV